MVVNIILNKIKTNQWFILQLPYFTVRLVGNLEKSTLCRPFANKEVYMDKFDL